MSVNQQILEGLRCGFKDFLFKSSASSRTFSNIAAPLAGIIEFYQREDSVNFEYEFNGSQNDYVSHTGFNKSIVVEDCIERLNLMSPLDRVWKFSSSAGVAVLCQNMINAVRESGQISAGILQGIEWCINEAMDNVLQHSQAQFGYIMGQLQRDSHRLCFCVFDSGIGIYNSLRPSKHFPRNPLDAITLALQEKVTRDEYVGQGNGMWGLSQIVKENGGQIYISSGGASYSYTNGNLTTFESGRFRLSKNHGTTLVDFQLDYSKPVDISKALSGHKMIDLWLEDRELDNGSYRFLVSKESRGTGTRKAGEAFRNVVLNTFRDTKQKIIIDFDAVNLVSSSYADELIGKIISEYGFIFFITNFEIINLSDSNKNVVNRSVEQRMAQKYYDNALRDSPDV